MVILLKRKPKQQIREDLSTFLQQDTDSFVDWYDTRCCLHFEVMGSNFGITSQRRTCLQVVPQGRAT